MEIKRIDKSDLKWVSELLGQSFAEDPMFNFVLGNQINNKRKMEWIQGRSFIYACSHGECYATEDNSGVLFMLSPAEVKVTFMKMAKAGMLALPIKLGMKTFFNFSELMGHVDKEHFASTNFDHYYIMVMGVLPVKQGKGIGKKLLNHALEIIDRQNLTCYLETQNIDNVAIYKKFGIEIISNKKLPKGDLQNWGMVRKQVKGQLKVAND